MNIRLELEKFKSENSNVIGCGFGDKHGLTMARVGDLNADDVAVGVNTIQEIITATEEAGFSIPRTVTVESYRPNETMLCTQVDEGFYLIQLVVA